MIKVFYSTTVEHILLCLLHHLSSWQAELYVQIPKALFSKSEIFNTFPEQEAFFIQQISK